MKLVDYLDSFQQMLDHPRHRTAQDSLAELVRQLRAYTNVDEGDEFQRAWLAGMSPRAVMQIAPTGQPMMDRSVRRVHPRSLLKNVA